MDTEPAEARLGALAELLFNNDGSPLPAWVRDLASSPDTGVRAGALSVQADNAFWAARGHDLDEVFTLLAAADLEFAVTEMDAALVPFRYSWLRTHLLAVDRLEVRQEETERAATAAYRFALDHNYDNGIRVGKTNLGLWAASIGRPVEALLHFVDLFSIMPPDERFHGFAHRGIARLLAGAGLHADSLAQFRLAADCLQRAEASPSEQVVALVDMGLVAVAAGELDEAVVVIARINDLLEEVPANDYTARAGPRLIEVRLRIAQGRIDEAVELFAANETLINDAIPQFHWHPGQIEADVLLAAGRPQAALDRLQRIPELFPVQLPHQHLLLADIAEQQEQWEAAIEHLREAERHRSLYVFDPGIFLGIGRTRLTEQEEAVAELVRSTEHAGQQIAARDTMLSHVIHEVRGPLTALTGQLDLWRMRDEAPEDAGDLLQSMVERIQLSLDSILDEVDSDGPGPEPAALDVLIAEVVALFEPAAAVKGSTIRWDQSTPLDVVGAVDPIRLALSNLISNALKYGPPDSTIEVRCETEGGSGPVATVTVLDQGPGFTDADLERAFEPHTRLSAQPTGGETSTGVGLSLVKAAIESCGGTAQIRNRALGGAAVSLTVPVVPIGARSGTGGGAT